jgi:hypothetical protein
MSRDDDERRSRENDKIVRSAREEAAVAVRQFNNARRAGRVTSDVRSELARAALNYYDALYEYRDEGALDTEWSERGIEWLEAAADRTVTVDKRLPRRNGATQKTQKPAILTVAPSRLRDAIRELNDVAKELGFSRSAREVTPSDEADMSDLRGLLKSRGQTEALKNLPGSDPEGEAGD